MIKQIKTLGKINGHNEKDTLLVLDLDDTVIWSPAKTPVWYNKRLNALMKEGFNRTTAQSILSHEMDHPSNTKLVERKIAEIVSSAYNVIALTARNAKYDKYTREQLSHVGVKIETILYSDLNSKGEVLFSFLHKSKTSLNPKKIIFVDNLLENCEEVQKWFPSAECYYYISKTESK